MNIMPPSFLQLGSIADRTISEADQDSDGEISFEEFAKVVSYICEDKRRQNPFLDDHNRMNQLIL